MSRLLSGRPGVVAGAIAGILVIVGIGATLLAVGSIPQDPRYHELADTRPFEGIPNFANVVSNLPFLVVGVAGLAHIARRGATAGTRWAWSALFAGSALIAFGSAWYHWAPTSARLVWDRLPMAIGFMGLLAAVVGEHFGDRLGRATLVPALLAGIGSVIWWARYDDLRPYVVVHAAPIVGIVIALAFLPGRYTHRHWFAYALGLYVLAKVAELGDLQIYERTGHALSGHSLKHLLAATSLGCLYLMLRRRRPTSPASVMEQGVRCGSRA